LAKLIELGGVRVVHSYGDLWREIDAYRRDPRRDAEGRRRMREEQLGSPDGRASERVASALATLHERLLGSSRCDPSRPLPEQNASA
jgi:hypothetical protein